MAGYDWLDGYTLQELLGAPPVSKTKKQLKQEKKAVRKAEGKRGLVSATVGAPFRLIGTVAKLPVIIASKLVGGIVGAVTEVVKLPVRIVGAVFSPWKKQ